MQRFGHGFRQTKPSIDLPQQHQAAIRTERAPFKIRLNLAAVKASKQHLLTGTIWHRRNTPL
jgi:hypothetical protein